MSSTNNTLNGEACPADEALADTQPGLDELERAVEDLPEAADEDQNEPEPTLANVGKAVVQRRDNVTQLSPSPTWQLGDWLRISGQGLGAASTATSAGFSFARGATSLSLNIAKRLTQAAVAIPAMAIDTASGSVPTGESATVSSFAHKSVGGLFDLISTLALGGIDIGSALTTAGLGAAATGMEGVHRSLGSEVVKSAGQFVRLVQRTWNESNDSLPPGGIPGFGLTGVTRALIAWICIQMVTRADYEKQMLQELEEFDLAQLRNEIEQEQRSEREQRGGGVSQVRITSEDSGQAGDVIGAEIGRQRLAPVSKPITAGEGIEEEAKPLSNKAAVQGLLRYSDLVLAVYGGTALAWFGVLPKDEAIPAAPSNATSRDDGALPADGLSREQDEEQFLRAAAMMDLPEDERIETAKTLRTSHMPGGFSHAWDGASTQEIIFTADPEEIATGSQMSVTPTESVPSPGQSTATETTAPPVDKLKYTYMTLLSGQHDDDLFHRVGGVSREHTQAGSYDEHPGFAPPAKSTPSQDTAAISEICQPRYYVVTDHTSRKIVLVLRGSMTLGEIFTDLTCESRRFEFPQEKEDAARRREAAQASDAAEGSSGPHRSSDPMLAGEETDEIDLVHEGMYEAACALGGPGRPVHRAVHAALAAQPGYGLDIIGHSLGAGVASLLAILWADPRTTLTTPASGLPAARKLHAYCYACPCTMSAALGSRCANLITTYALSYDLVCRLSLGSVKDIRNACAWILYEDKQQAQTQSQRNTGAGASSPEDGVGFDPKDRSTPLRITTLLTRAFEHQAGRLDDTAAEEDSEEREIAPQPEPTVPVSLASSTASSASDTDDTDTIAGEGEADANADLVSLAPTVDTTFTSSTSTTSSSDTSSARPTQNNAGPSSSPRQPRPSKKRQVEQDFLALRRTLEANMRNVELYPPGQIIYLFRGGDLITDAPAGSGQRPAHTVEDVHQKRDHRRKVPRAFTLRTPTAGGGGQSKAGKVEKVFAQIQFSKGLLSTHMPHAYGQVLKAGGSDSSSK